MGINSTTGASCLTVGVGVSEPLWADLGSFEASAVHLWRTPSFTLLLHTFIVFTEGHLLCFVFIRYCWLWFVRGTLSVLQLFLYFNWFASFAICILSRSSPSDVAVNYDDSVLQHDDQTLSWGRKIVRLSVPDEVACRLPLAATILPCNMSWSSQNSSLHDAVPSIGFHSCSQTFQMGVSWGSLLSCHTRTLTLSWSFSQLSSYYRIHLVHSEYCRYSRRPSFFPMDKYPTPQVGFLLLFTMCFPFFGFVVEEDPFVFIHACPCRRFSWWAHIFPQAPYSEFISAITSSEVC